MSAEQTLPFQGAGDAAPPTPAAQPKPVGAGARDPFDLGWAPKHNPWAVAVVVTLAAFMEILDTTIVNVALPHIAGSLSSSNDEATWALTSYLVANGIVLTISGWLGSLLGRKRYFLICLAMFTVCSFLCGIATSLPQLILFRLLQGLLRRRPAAEPAIDHSRLFPPAKRGAAFGLTAIATIVGPVIGRRLAASSPIPHPGAGFSSSTCRSASPRSSLFISLSRIRRGEAPATADRRYRPRSYRRTRSRLPRSDDGPRRGRRLVRFELHCDHGDALRQPVSSVRLYGCRSQRSRSSVLPSSRTRTSPAAA